MTSPLRQARIAMGWTASQLAEKLLTVARELELDIASPSSLRVMISRWENGKSRPDARAIVLLEHVFGLQAVDLGLVNDEEGVQSPLLRQVAERSGKLSDLGLKYFEEQLQLHVRMDNVSGSLWVADIAKIQLQQLEESANSDSAEVSLLSARYAEFLGWLLHDSGKVEKGLAYTEKAIEFAELANDIALTVYALMRKSNILTYLGKSKLALMVGQRAVHKAQKEVPDLLPICLRQLALAYAHCGNEKSFRAAFEHAISLTRPTIDSSNQLASYCTTSYVEMEAALCWLKLGKPNYALNSCERALSNWPDALLRDQALCHARRAISHAELNNVDAACHAGQEALQEVQSAPSARTIHMLQLTTRRLEPFRRNQGVRELNDALISFISQKGL